MAVGWSLNYTYANGTANHPTVMLWLSWPVCHQNVVTENVGPIGESAWNAPAPESVLIGVAGEYQFPAGLPNGFQGEPLHNTYTCSVAIMRRLHTTDLARITEAWHMSSPPPISLRDLITHSWIVRSEGDILIASAVLSHFNPLHHCFVFGFT